ncbi:hypothetical protein DK871_09690 [Pseudomonas sp. L13]|nr:hypothetical protein [Pseudomonas sp. L13]
MARVAVQHDRMSSSIVVTTQQKEADIVGIHADIAFQHNGAGRNVRVVPRLLPFDRRALWLPRHGEKVRGRYVRIRADPEGLLYFPFHVVGQWSTTIKRCAP